MSVYPTITPNLKETVRAAATGNVATLSGVQTIDTVALVAGDRVLLPYQTTASQNGVYVVQAGAWARAADTLMMQTAAPGHEVHVAEGNLNGRTIWLNTNTGNVTVGTTSLTYTRTYPSYGGLFNDPWDPNIGGDNIEREAVTSTLTQVSGTLYLHGHFILRAGKTYSAVNIFFTSAGATVTHTWAGLASVNAIGPYSARQLIAVSADNTAAPTANAVRTFTFGAAVTPAQDTMAWVALLLAATTVPAVAAGVAMSNAALPGLAPILVGTSNTAQTTPIALNTVLTAPTATAQLAYAYLS